MPLGVRSVVSALEGAGARCQGACVVVIGGTEGKACEAPVVCRSSPPGDLAVQGWACRLLPAASDVIRSGVKPFGVWCNWQHD